MLVFDVNKKVIDEYQIGSPISNEESFQNTASLRKADGYDVSLVKNTIDTIYLIFTKDHGDCSIFHGRLLIGDNTYDLNCNTTRGHLISIFGLPCSEWNDGVEECSEFAFLGLHVEYIWSVEDSKQLTYIAFSLE